MSLHYLSFQSNDGWIEAIFEQEDGWIIKGGISDPEKYSPDAVFYPKMNENGTAILAERNINGQMRQFEIEVELAGVINLKSIKVNFIDSNNVARAINVEVHKLYGTINFDQSTQHQGLVFSVDQVIKQEMLGDIPISEKRII